MRQLQSFPIKRTLAFVLVLACLWAGFAVAQQGGNGYSGQASVPGFDASTITLDGDVTGPASANTVSAIQHNAVVPGALVAGQALFANDAGIWAPETFQGDLSCSATNPGSCSVVSVSGSTPIPITPNEFQWNNSTTPLIDEASESTAVKGNDFTWQPQQSTHATDQGGGNAIVNLQTPTGAGVEAALLVKRGASEVVAVGPLVGSPGYGAVTFVSSPSGSNYALSGNGTYTYVGAPNSGGAIFMGSAGGISIALYNTANGGAEFNVPLTGYSTTPLAFATAASAIACGTGGTQTIPSSPKPGQIITSGTLASNCVLDFSTNASTGHFELDMSGVTLGATFGVQFKNGSATITYTTASVVSGTLAIVYTHGSNTLAVNY